MGSGVNEILLADVYNLDWKLIAACDGMLTDPPYSEHVHRNATSQSAGGGTRHRDLGFDSLPPHGPSFLVYWASLVKRWSVIYSDVEQAHVLWETAEKERPTTLEYVRTVPWVRWSMPQLSGDRPPQGFEMLLCFHPPGKKRWNGPGNLTHFAHLAMRGDEKHKCQKGLDQALDLVSFFTEEGETIFVPFSGAGTIELACQLLNRSCIGLELDPVWHAKACARLLAPLSAEDVTRCQRWLEQKIEPAAQQKEGPSVERLRSRERDRALLLERMR